MTKKDLALFLLFAEATRKSGGISFEVMPLAAKAVQAANELLSSMGEADTLIIQKAQDAEQPGSAKNK